MTFVNWEDDLDLGIPSVDAQHRDLARRLNAFLEGLFSGAGHDGVLGLLDELLAATEKHFASEEALLDRSGYPDLANHAAEHARLLSQLRHFRERYAAGEMPREMSLETSDYLREWLVDHIRKGDRAFRPYVMRLA